MAQRDIVFTDPCPYCTSGIPRVCDGCFRRLQTLLGDARAGLEGIAYDTVVPGWIREIAHNALVASDLDGSGR